MIDFISSLIIPFITIFVIMDPFPSIIPFLTYNKKATDKERFACALRAVTIAGVLALLFLFGGPTLLSYLHITLNDFRIAGGIVLVILGIETVLGISLGSHNADDTHDVALLIATPLLTGPGLATTLIIVSEEHGLLATIVSLSLALLLSWSILVNSVRIRNVAGDKIIHIASRIIGLLLLALGVAYIRIGLVG